MHVPQSILAVEELRGLMLGSHHLIGAKANRPVLGAVQKCALPALLRHAAARRWTWPAALRWALPSAEVVRRGATAEGVSWLERRGCEVLRAAAIAPGKMVGCEAAQCLGRAPVASATRSGSCACGCATPARARARRYLTLESER